MIAHNGFSGMLRVPGFRASAPPPLPRQTYIVFENDKPLAGISATGPETVILIAIKKFEIPIRSAKRR